MCNGAHADRGPGLPVLDGRFFGQRWPSPSPGEVGLFRSKMRHMEGFSPKGKGPHEVGLEFGCIFVLGDRKNSDGALAVFFCTDDALKSGSLRGHQY